MHDQDSRHQELSRATGEASSALDGLDDGAHRSSQPAPATGLSSQRDQPRRRRSADPEALRYLPLTFAVSFSVSADQDAETVARGSTERICRGETAKKHRGYRSIYIGGHTAHGP